jgi:hypothetical protein
MPQHDKTHVTSYAKRGPSWGSNPRPYIYGAHALPTELRSHFHAIVDVEIDSAIRAARTRAAANTCASPLQGASRPGRYMELIVQSNIGIGTSSCSGWKVFAPFRRMLLDSMTPSSRARASQMCRAVLRTSAMRTARK